MLVGLFDGSFTFNVKNFKYPFPYCFNQSFRSSPNLAAAAEAAALAVIRPVEAKYPALLFKQQLAAYVEKIFGMIRDNLKKELSALISLCIQVSLTSLFTAIYIFPTLYPNAVTTSCCFAL